MQSLKGSRPKILAFQSFFIISQHKPSFSKRTRVLLPPLADMSAKNVGFLLCDIHNRTGGYFLVAEKLCELREDTKIFMFF